MVAGEWRVRAVVCGGCGVAWRGALKVSTAILSSVFRIGVPKMCPVQVNGFAATMMAESLRRPRSWCPPFSPRVVGGTFLRRRARRVGPRIVSRRVVSWVVLEALTRPRRKRRAYVVAICAVCVLSCRVESPLGLSLFCLPLCSSLHPPPFLVASSWSPSSASLLPLLQGCVFLLLSPWHSGVVALCS